MTGAVASRYCGQMRAALRRLIPWRLFVLVFLLPILACGSGGGGGEKQLAGGAEAVNQLLRLKSAAQYDKLYERLLPEQRALLDDEEFVRCGAYEDPDNLRTGGKITGTISFDKRRLQLTEDSARNHEAWLATFEVPYVVESGVPRVGPGMMVVAQQGSEWFLVLVQNWNSPDPLMAMGPDDCPVPEPEPLPVGADEAESLATLRLDAALVTRVLTGISEGDCSPALTQTDIESFAARLGGADLYQPPCVHDPGNDQADELNDFAVLSFSFNLPGTPYMPTRALVFRGNVSITPHDYESYALATLEADGLVVAVGGSSDTIDSDIPLQTYKAVNRAIATRILLNLAA